MSAALSGGGDTGSEGDVLDVEHLVRQTMGDTALEHELLRMFVQQSHALLGRIGTAGPTDRAIAAHTLKGSARAIGAWRVAEAAAAIESGSEAVGDAGLAAAVAAANAAIARRLEG